MKTKYYIRVEFTDKEILEEHLERSGTEFICLSHDFSNKGLSCLYSIYLEPQEALALKLAIPLVGCLDFHKALNKLTQHSS